MAIKTTKGLTPWWYTPDSQQGDDKPARFKVRPLSGEEQNVAAEGMHYDADKGAVTLSGKSVSYVLQRCLQDWENVDGEDGPLPCRVDNHRWLPGNVRAEIALHVYVESVLSEDQAKN